jgi:hypothetical protein
MLWSGRIDNEFRRHRFCEAYDCLKSRAMSRHDVVRFPGLDVFNRLLNDLRLRVAEMKPAQDRMELISSGYPLQMLDRVHDARIGAAGKDHPSFVFYLNRNYAAVLLLRPFWPP